MAQALRSAKTASIRDTDFPYQLIAADADCGGEESAVQTVLGSPLTETDLGPDTDPLPLVIIGRELEQLREITRAQRQSPEACLRPIAVIGVPLHSPDPATEQLVDVMLPAQPSLEQLRDMSVTLGVLHRQLQSLPQAHGDSMLLLLQFLYTRNIALEPLNAPDEPGAYAYPMAELMLDENSETVSELFDDMAQHDIVSASHIDRLFTCPDCGHYRVCVKELCPECDSTHLKAQESIHHFRCGHVAPEADFLRSGRPQCPKCHGAIKHIGVEYNRPGQFVVCGECQYWATEPLLSAWCAVCNAYHDPAELRALNIQAYSLNQPALSIARRGSWNPQDAISDAPQEAPVSEPPPARKKPGKSKSRKSKPNIVSRMVAKIADVNDHPTATYIAQVREHDESSDWREVLATARNIIQEYAHESLLCVDIREGEMIIVLHDSPDRRTPTCRQLEKVVLKESGVDLLISERDEDDTGLRAQAVDRLA